MALAARKRAPEDESRSKRSKPAGTFADETKIAKHAVNWQ
jgi:hypothetical protein